MGHVFGKIRAFDLNPIDGLHIHLYSRELKLLGRTRTYDGGHFDLNLNGTHGIPVMYIIREEEGGHFEAKASHNAIGIPDTFIIDKNQNRMMLRIALEDILEQRHSNPALRRQLMDRLEKKYENVQEIEYQIIIYEENQWPVSEPNSSDIYGRNETRAIMSFEEVLESVLREYAVNINHRNIEGLNDDTLQLIEDLIDKFPNNRENLEQYLRRVRSLFDGYVRVQQAEYAAEWGEILYEYDGPQVPSKPREKFHYDVVMWPR